MSYIHDPYTNAPAPEKPIMKKEQELKEILDLDLRMSEIGMEKSKKSSAYVKKYCPYKKGDRLNVKLRHGSDNLVEVAMIHFDMQSNIEGMARLVCYPIGKDGVRKKNRNAVHIFNKEEILTKAL